MASSDANHWLEVARRWSLIGPPIRPSPQDTAFARAAIAEWLYDTRPKQPWSLILGVTTELREASMAEGVGVIGVDRNRAMIRALSSDNARAGGGSLCGDWRRLPLPAESVDLVLADGSFTLLAFPAVCAEVCAELRRVMRTPGRCVVRCFVQSKTRETSDEVFSDLSRGRIGSFRVLQWRLAMALQPEARSGVSIGRIWEALHEEWPDLDLLADLHRWPREVVRSIDGYRNGDVRYSFPALPEYVEFFRSAGFPVARIETPTYELGERCPTLVLEKR